MKLHLVRLKEISVIRIIYLTVFLLSVSIHYSTAFADDIFPQGARSGGMGNAYIALAEDALAIYHNPAGLMLLTGISADIFVGSPGLPFPENWSMFYAKPAIVGDRIGMGVIHQVREIDNRTYRSYQVILPTTLAVSKRILTGLNLKYVTQKSGALSYKAKMSADYGMLYNHGIFRMGLMLRDFVDLKMSSFPQNWIAGFAINFSLLKIEVDKSVGAWDEITMDDESIRIGCELNPVDVLSLRAGLDRTGVVELRTVGFTVSNNIKSIRLEYCLQFESDDYKNGTHWISYNYLVF